MNFIKILPYILSALPLAGCADPLSLYEEVQGLRVLAISADRPQLVPGASATMSALVTEDATYAWSWCPLAEPTLTGADCAITHGEFQAIADQILTPQVIAPDYNLGSGPTAVFMHEISPVFYQTVCEFLLSENVPDGFSPPDCTSSFAIQVKLIVSSGTETITSVSSLDLLYDETLPANQNPVLSGISAKVADGQEFILSDSEATEMMRGQSYELLLDIEEDSSETYSVPGESEENQENLIATWFSTAGTIDKARSSFIPGSVGIDVLQTNDYTTPTLEEFSGTSLMLYFVIRDGRGGTSFQTREITLETP